jgi:hypothetical protein
MAVPCTFRNPPMKSSPLKAVDGINSPVKQIKIINIRIIAPFGLMVRIASKQKIFKISILEFDQ